MEDRGSWSVIVLGMILNIVCIGEHIYRESREVSLLAYLVFWQLLPMDEQVVFRLVGG